MTETAPHGTGEDPFGVISVDVDYALVDLVGLVDSLDDTNATVAVTLLVDGAWIEGLLVGAAAWLDHVAHDLQVQAPDVGPRSLSMVPDVAQLLHHHAELVRTQRKAASDWLHERNEIKPWSEIRKLCLLDARPARSGQYYAPGVGIPMRLRISSVSGWSIGVKSILKRPEAFPAVPDAAKFRSSESTD